MGVPPRVRLRAMRGKRRPCRLHVPKGRACEPCKPSESGALWSGATAALCAKPGEQRPCGARAGRNTDRPGASLRPSPGGTLAGMPTVRVQIRQTLADAPSVGTWNVYRGGWFTVTGSTTPTYAVQRLLVDMFNGLRAPNTGGTANTWTSTSVYRLGITAGRLKVWTVSGGALTLAHQESVAVMDSPMTPGPTEPLPYNLAVAVGYRANLGSGVPHQRGRSRFFVGPLLMKSGGLNRTTGNGGARLAEGVVDTIAENFAANVASLRASGWSLGVRVLGSDTLHDVTECYVDDLLDVQRSRKSWVNYQKRVSL